MNCAQVLTENLVERYLAGQLDEETRDAFELHYFECPACHEMVQAVQTAGPVLVEMAVGRRGPQLLWVWLAAAAAVVVATGIFFTSGQKPAAAPVAAVPAVPATPAVMALLRLSDIQPAPYEPRLFRGAETESGMAAAMRLYEGKKWAEAGAALAKLAPGQPGAGHFAGISLLLAGETEPALAALDRVIALGGRTPYAEEARYYRAQALLVTGRGTEAREELRRVVELQGDYEARARALMGRF